MKKMFVIIMVLSIPAVSFAEEIMKIVYFENYAPFSWKENDQMRGILVDVLNEVIKTRMGIPLSHQGYPWERAQMMVKVNEADAFVTVPTPERRSYTEVSSEPVILATFTMFIKKGRPDIEKFTVIKSIADIGSFKIGHYLGSGWAKKKFAGMTVDWAATLDQTLVKLLKDRFDIFIDTSQVVRYNINRLGYQDRIIELPNIIDSTSFNLCIGKKSSYIRILPKFDETIRKMRDDGSLKKIYDKYGAPKY